jgi:ASC-1-like (ASCH) protein
MLHELNILPRYFVAITKGRKRFEIRKNDRGFQPGDWLHLKEHDPREGFGYSGSECVVRVTYMSDYDQKPGNVVLGITDPI